MNVSVIPIINTVIQIDKLLKFEFNCSLTLHSLFLATVYLKIEISNFHKLEIYLFFVPRETYFLVSKRITCLPTT